MGTLISSVVKETMEECYGHEDAAECVAQAMRRNRNLDIANKSKHQSFMKELMARRR